MRKEVDKDNNNFDLLQQFILLLFYSGKYIKPLKNDYADLELIYNKDNITNKNYILIDNHKKKNTLFIHNNKMNVYKQYNINKGCILNKYLSILLNYRMDKEQKYLLVNSKNNQKMSKNNLTKYLQRIFSRLGKKISSSVLRNIYISELDFKQEEKISKIY